jgi:thioredoxin reductase (NADPH)
MNNDATSQGGAPEGKPEGGPEGTGDSALEEEQTPRSNPRYDQMFPVLTESEIERVIRFGAPRSYAAGEMLYRAGGASPGMFVLLSGTIRYARRDGLGHRRLLRARVQRGEFTSDIGMLSGKPGLVDAEVTENVEALVIPPDRLRALMIADAELGERIMRALILRRVAAIERGQGAVLVGAPDDARLLALQYFLRRNGHPHMALDVHDVEAIALLACRGGRGRGSCRDSADSYFSGGACRFGCDSLAVVSSARYQFDGVVNKLELAGPQHFGEIVFYQPAPQRPCVCRRNVAAANLKR